MPDAFAPTGPLDQIERHLTQAISTLSLARQALPAAIKCAACAKRRDLADTARQLYRHRRRRVALLDGDLFGEPAWDILLDLYIQQAAGKQVSISSACVAAAVPSTTALRWLRLLTKQGLIERIVDPRDRRRVFVHLTRRAVDALEIHLAEL